jgi:hypothetical protein
MYSKQEAEIFRCPTDYLRWFQTLLDRLREKTATDKSIHRAASTHQRPYKEIFEEFFPLASLLKIKQSEWQESRFRNVLGNQPYDVEVQNHSLRYLEITGADFDDAERFRILELLEHGSVDAIARIDRDKNGRPASIHQSGSYRRCDEVIQEQINLIRSRIENKLSKPDRYLKGTGLIVYFDDFRTPIFPEHIEPYQQLVLDTKPLWAPYFEVVFLVGPGANGCVEEGR